MRKSFFAVAAFAVFAALSPAVRAYNNGALSISAATNIMESVKKQEVSAGTLSLAAAYRYSFDDGMYLGLDWGFATVVLERELQEKVTGFDLANPIISAGYIFRPFGQQYKADVGLRVGAPLATFPGNIPDNRLSEFNFNNTVSAYGWRDPFLWLMNVVPIVADAALTDSLSDIFSVKARMSPALLVSVNRLPSRFALLGGLEVEARMELMTARLGWNYFFSSLALENNDKDQQSVWLGFDFPITKTSMMKVDLNVNLDTPNGVAADDPKPAIGGSVGYSLIAF